MRRHRQHLLGFARRPTTSSAPTMPRSRRTPPGRSRHRRRGRRCHGRAGRTDLNGNVQIGMYAATVRDTLATDATPAALAAMIAALIGGDCKVARAGRTRRPFDRGGNAQTRRRDAADGWPEPGPQFDRASGGAADPARTRACAVRIRCERAGRYAPREDFVMFTSRFVDPACRERGCRLATACRASLVVPAEPIVQTGPYFTVMRDVERHRTHVKIFDFRAQVWREAVFHSAAEHGSKLFIRARAAGQDCAAGGAAGHQGEVGLAPSAARPPVP